MDCSECTSLLSAYLDGELSPEETAIVEEHLAECPDCTAVFDDMQAVDNITKRSVELNLPGKEFKQRVMDELPPSRLGISRWHGPVAFVLLALLTIGILVGVNRWRKGAGGTTTEEERDLQRELTLVTPGGEMRIKTPVNVATNSADSAPHILQLPHGAVVVFRGALDVGWTKTGVQLTPAGETVLFVTTPDQALKDVLIRLPGGKVTGFGMTFAVVVQAGAGEAGAWRVYSLAGRTRVADRSGENRVKISDRVLGSGMEKAAAFDADEIAGVLQPLLAGLPEKPLLPYSAAISEESGLLAMLPTGLDANKTISRPGPGKGIIAALSVIGPPERSVIYLRRQGENFSLLRGGKEKTLDLPEGEKPKLLLASASLGFITVNEGGNLFRAEPGNKRGMNALAETPVKEVKHFVWEPYGRTLYLAGPGGIAGVDAAHGLLTWQETRLHDIVGMAVDAEGNVVCAGSDGTLTILGRNRGKVVEVYGPVGQAFTLPPVVDGGKIMALGENGRLVEVSGGKISFRDIEDFPGAESWGVRGDYVYFRSRGMWYRCRISEERLELEGPGDAWGVMDASGLLRASGAELYRADKRIAGIPAGGFPLLLPQGLLITGDDSETYLPFLK